MAEESGNASAASITNFFELVLNFSDKGVGVGHTGCGDGNLSIAEVNQTFREQGIPKDNPFYKLVCGMLQRFPQEKVPISDIAYAFRQLIKSYDSCGDGIINPANIAKLDAMLDQIKTNPPALPRARNISPNR